MTKDNDLVKRLRKRQEFEFIDGYKRIEWEDDDALEAADRIEELEAKLAKAVQAMQEAIKLADMPHYGDREDALDNCFDAIDLLRTTISELNGDKP